MELGILEVEPFLHHRLRLGPRRRLYVGGKTRREESFGKKSKHPAANLWQKFSFEYVYAE
jgi:hypothetical protein